MTGTPNDRFDNDIRDAVAEVVAAAPPPIPYDRLAEQMASPAPNDRRGWWTAAAAVAIVVAGVAAISLVAGTRSDRTTDASTPPASPTSPASTPGTTVESTTPSTRPPLPDPAGFSTGPFPDIPEGSLDAGSGDLIGLTSDGTVSLYPDALTAEPGEPVVLTTRYPRPGQAYLGLVAVALNGSLISSLPVDFDADQPTQVTTVSQPESTPVPLVGGSLGAVSHDGTRFLVRERDGVRDELAVYDARHGTVTRRGMAAFPSDQAGDGAFVWSQDDRELYSFTPDNGVRQAAFTRIDSVTLEVIDTTVVEDWGLAGRPSASEHAYFAGTWDGHVIFSTSDGGVRAYTMPGLVAAEIDDPAWWISDSVTFDIAAEGNTAVWIADGTTYVQRVGEAPVAVRDDLVEVGFVDAVAADPTPPPATTAPELPGLFPAPGDTELSTFTAIAPSGSIDAAPGDIVSLAVDGDLWLHRGAFDPPQYGRTPDEPVRLVDGEDPRVSGEEGPGPNVVDWVGGFVNGALMYGDCCEPAAGNVLAVSDPEGPAALLGYGWTAAADPTGRRWATASDYGLQLLDFDTGRGVSRIVNPVDGERLNVGEVTWVGDELWLLGWSDIDGSALVLYQADATLAEIARRELAPSDGGVPTATHTFAGRLADGTIVLTETTGGFDSDARTTGLRFLAPDGEDAAIESPWPALPPEAQGIRVSPDGTTLAYTIDNTAYLLRAGQEPVEWGTDVRSVWFVTTPPMPIGTPCPAPEPDGFRLIDGVPFADLDGDGISERIMLRTDGPLHWVRGCGTSSTFADTEIYAAAAGSRTVVPVDIEGDGQAELWITNATFHGTSPDLPCVALYRAAGSILEPTTENRCIGDVGFACVAVDGVVQPVFYERAGDTLTAILDDATVLGARTYEPGELDEMYDLFDLAC